MLTKLFYVLAFLVLVPVAITAQTNSRDMEKEKVIWTQLQANASAALEDFKAATVAMDAGNYEEAARLYEAVRKKAPESDHVLRRLGTCLASLGKLDDGLKFLELAVKKNRSPENLISLANFIAYPGTGQEAPIEKKRRAYDLAREANQKQKTGNDPEYLILVGQLALEFNDVDEFRRTTEQLVARHPDQMATHYFNAILSANDQKWTTAEKEIRTAEAMGLPHDVAQQFLDSGVHFQAQVWHYAIYAGVLVGVWILGLTLLFLIGKFMSRKTLRAIEASGPTSTASASDISLRKRYRALINLAGLYYYISIPVVIFLVIAVAASVTYGFYMIGRIPIKLIAILFIAALITIYKMIRSLFLKIESEDPGRSLSHEEAPALWELTREVAAAVGTRPVDEIRVTPATDMAVYEEGSFRERSQDKARRILIIGVGVLNDFQQNGFRAVLAHEYGHFSHRDTAGGDIALRVNADMMKFAHAMVLSGQAVWWNIAFQFLRVYHFIFRRISHGATRLQEVLADRVAASQYGPLAFEEGLTHVVRKSVEFDYTATNEINESANSRRALQNIYELQTVDNPDLHEAIAKALDRETTEDDTHPSPKDRFRFIRRVVVAAEQPATGKVWDLFKDKDALTLEMTKTIENQLSGA